MRILILAYPGTGARELLLKARNTSFHVTHLDEFGFRKPRYNYWKWLISVEVLRRHLDDDVILNRDHMYIGWGHNWRQIVGEFSDVDITSYLKISDNSYLRNVELYRASEEYNVDLALIRKSPNDQKMDYPIEQHCWAYNEFCLNASLRGLHEVYFLDDLLGECEP
jgi:hypothetical protein